MFSPLQFDNLQRSVNVRISIGYKYAVVDVAITESLVVDSLFSL